MNDDKKEKRPGTRMKIADYDRSDQNGSVLHFELNSAANAC